MARMFHWLGLAALGLVMTGCVSQEKYNALKLERDRYAEQLGQAQTDASTARAEADLLKQQLAALGSNDANQMGLVANLTQQNADLQRQLDELNRRYSEAIGKIGQGAALPEPLDNALREFAAANPDLVDFDSARGIVKFKSDVTFALGSAELTSNARTAIGRFAQILNSSAASGYELMVAGHTDNTRVSRQETIAAGHKDNWYLSAHRAIAVGSELQSQRVNPQRLAVVGYADQRPVASNSSESGRAQNRRVEVLILPTTVRGSSGATVAAGSNSKPQANLNKDTAADTTPALNK